MGTPQAGWFRFPNGRVWFVDPSFWAEGVVAVADYESFDDLEQRLDAIAEAATGSIIGLSDFAYTYLGGDFVAFRGNVSSCFEEDEDAPAPIDPRSVSFAEHLRSAYGFSQEEVEHAVRRITEPRAFGEEITLPLAGTNRALVMPHPNEPGSRYVRVVVAGNFEMSCVEVADGETEVFHLVSNAASRQGA